MKRTHFLSLTLPLLLAAICLSACKDKKDQPQPTEKAIFTASLTAQDTTDVLNLSETCMQTLKAGKVEEALAQLYLWDDSTKAVKPLDEAKKQELRKTFKLFPVLDYSLAHFTFSTQGLNDVKYNIVFFEKEADDPTPNTIGFMFNPVKVDGKWYLSVKEADQKVESAKSQKEE